MSYTRCVFPCILIAVVGVTFLRVTDAACNAETQFECQSGRCIPLYWRCDFKSNCDNGEDEEGCETATCTSEFPYQCPSGKCIPQSWVCDLSFRQDCPGGEDQMNCPFDCSDTRYYHQCDDTVCIYATLKCDGKPDCPDGSDENNCGGGLCPNGTFECNSGQCIDQDLVCDQDPDCPGNEQEDEENCSGDRFCDKFWFRCDNGVCILGYLQCDGYDNCKNGEDEICGLNCHQCDGWIDPSVQCHPDDYRVPSFCDAGMTCSSSLKRNLKGDLVYTVGCKGKNYCSYQEANNPAACYGDTNNLLDDEKCTFCCEGDYCNSYNSLPLPPFTTEAPGLQCHSCDSWSRADSSCGSTVETCAEGEICAITYKLNARGKLMYIASCKKKFYCKSAHTEDTACDVSQQDKCIFCCDTDNCNSYDANPNVIGARK